MKKLCLMFIATFMLYNPSVFASAFYNCKSKYALCTTAACKPVPGKKDLVSCNCSVHDGYSVGASRCKGAKQTKEGEVVYSRYYPIKQYVRCSNSRPWAWCLDKPCIVDKKDPTKASCACTIAKNMGDYVIVAKQYSPKVCTTGIISSATVQQSQQITDFLKTQKTLQPFPIKVLNKN
ncbi:hypothetical protein BN59_03550 [Legionella massiliensis]|uniref:Secreted protein n=1 Tax=Legionella massiliensis TaxID=1034943 RepID=A0A078L1W2_9GAMM|nr:hypothetical protein [Legionella massiliensis]CDZ79232.1 hypothetical protein BN59_03550 [Legionella massiliensis]CEE14970.1 hypothetical protein BN1094_03550 [Legionella massiliensis]